MKDGSMVVEREEVADGRKVSGLWRGMFGAALLCGFSLLPELVVQADTGADLAQTYCGECHAADGEAMFGEPGPLGEVARTRQWTGGDLKAWLAASHPPMQPLPLTAQEVYELEQHLDALAREWPGL